MYGLAKGYGAMMGIATPRLQLWRLVQHKHKRTTQHTIDTTNTPTHHNHNPSIPTTALSCWLDVVYNTQREE
jgi:hypothetical protein